MTLGVVLGGVCLLIASRVLWGSRALVCCGVKVKVRSRKSGQLKCKVKCACTSGRVKSPKQQHHHVVQVGQTVATPARVSASRAAPGPVGYSTTATPVPLQVQYADFAPGDRLGLSPVDVVLPPPAALGLYPQQSWQPVQAQAFFQLHSPPSQHAVDGFASYTNVNPLPPSGQLTQLQPHMQYYVGGSGVSMAMHPSSQPLGQPAMHLPPIQLSRLPAQAAQQESRKSGTGLAVPPIV